jgi:Histidine acid phosphatase.
MVAKSKDKLKKKKIWIYSAHDTTVANLLNTLNIFDLHCPPYTAAVMIELHQKDDEYYVNVSVSFLNVSACLVSLETSSSIVDTYWGASRKIT